MMNGGGMADMIRDMMEKKKGGKNSFTMTGQYTSPVMQEEETGREYVMYDSPNGEQVKVYGNWNEYAVGRDENGDDMIADEDYPIVENEEGEFVLDEATFDGQMKGVDVAREAEGGPGASKMEDLMEMLGQMRGQGGEPAPGQYMRGGKIGGGGGGEADSDDAVITDGRRYENGGKPPPDDLFARPEAVNPDDPDSPKTYGFYVGGRRVSSQNFIQALNQRGREGKINEYVKSGAKYGPTYDKKMKKWGYTNNPRDERLQAFLRMQAEARREN